MLSAPEGRRGAGLPAEHAGRQDRREDAGRDCRSSREPEQAQVPGPSGQGKTAPSSTPPSPRPGWPPTSRNLWPTGRCGAGRACSPGTGSTPDRNCWPNAFPRISRARAPTSAPARGYLTKEVLTHCPKIQHMDLYEAEHRAIACAQKTLEGVENVTITWAATRRAMCRTASMISS